MPHTAQQIEIPASVLMELVKDPKSYDRMIATLKERTEAAVAAENAADKASKQATVDWTANNDRETALTEDRLSLGKKVDAVEASFSVSRTKIEDEREALVQLRERLAKEEGQLAVREADLDRRVSDAKKVDAAAAHVQESNKKASKNVEDQLLSLFSARLKLAEWAAHMDSMVKSVPGVPEIE